MKDQLMTVNVALPNAANTVNTNAIELPQQSVRPFTTDIRIQIATTAGTGANNKNITITLQGSNDTNTSNFAAITGLSTIVINEESSSYPATTREVYLLPDTNVKYIRASAVGEANGANAADGTLTLSVVS